MRPFLTTEFTELLDDSNRGAISTKPNNPARRYSLHYLDQNWRFINDKIPKLRLTDSSHIRNEVAEVEKLTIDERILELEESSLAERAVIEREYECFRHSDSVEELSKSLKIIKAFLGDRRCTTAFPSISTPTSERQAQQGNQNSASVNDRSQLRTAPVTVRPSTRNSTTSPRSRPKTGNLRARTAPSVEVASAMEPTLVEHSVEDKIVHRLAITQEQILQLDISKQFKCFTTENGYRSPLCLNKLTNFAAAVAPEKVADERPQSRPARADTRVSVTVVSFAEPPSTQSRKRRSFFGNKGRRVYDQKFKAV